MGVSEDTSFAVENTYLRVRGSGVCNAMNGESSVSKWCETIYAKRISDSASETTFKN
jgi:hypothetical protein